MNREEWLKLRMKGITGTDISALMGVNPWKKAKDVLNDKQGLGRPFVGNAYTRTGLLLESYVADQWSKENQKILINGAFSSHPSIPWAIGTPDFLFPGGVLEVKTGGESTWKKGLPKYYAMQVQWYMMLIEKTEGFLTALVVPKDRSECPQEGASPDFIREWCSYRPRLDFQIEEDLPLQHQMLKTAEEFLKQLDLTRTPSRVLGS